MDMEGGIPGHLPEPTRGMDYWRSRRNINNVVKMLRDVGTEEIIKLPKIAVIGNQSVGKSSLIEAISQIRLPRDSGTCTKCPMEVFLSSSNEGEEWKGKVLLRLQHETVDFGETTNKNDITLLLQRAQLAILNPDKRISEFQNLPKASCINYPSSQMFSSNTVVLEITGAEVDVTFIDLPGVIQNPPQVLILVFLLTSQGGGVTLVNLVLDMVDSYISEPDCLILLVVTITGFSTRFTNNNWLDDIENQVVPRIARHYDNEGQRTLGISPISRTN
jgi:GTPase SAR1 family protein